MPLNLRGPPKKMLQTQEVIKTGSYRYLRPNRSTKRCPAPGTKALQLHESFLLPTNKPHKNQKSPTKSLKVMISKAINSQVLRKLALGTNHVGKRQEKADSSCSDLRHASKQPAAILANARCLRGFQQGQQPTRTQTASVRNTHKTIRGELDCLLKDRTKLCTNNTERVPVYVLRPLFHSKIFAGASIQKAGGRSVSITPTPRYLCT